MSKLFFLFISIILFTACQKEMSSEIESSQDPNSSILITNLQGNIYDENSQPVAGVDISAGTQTTTTDNSGYFRFENVELHSNNSLVVAEKDGYFKAYRRFSPGSGTNQVAIKLIRRSLAGTINAGSGGEVLFQNGSKVHLNSNAVVSASSGIPYGGTVKIYASYIDPTTNDIGQTVPGSFTAIDKEGKTMVLSSYGMLAVELESSAGEKLQIAPGKSAMLTTAIPNSLLSSAPATIPLWFLDEQTGIWKEEGLAAKNGNSYIGEVKHFTFWNCDTDIPGVVFSGTIKTADQLPLVNACVRIKSMGAATFSYETWTDDLGQVKEFVPSGQSIDIEVLDPCRTVISSKSVGPFSKDTDIGTLYTAPGISIINIKGKVVGCSGEKLKKTFAVISVDNMIHHAPGDANGNFITNFLQCAGTRNTVEIYGVDATVQQQGNTISINTNGPTTDVGTISACGNALQQHITYTLDGTNYIILDSLDAYTINPGVNSTTYIFGKGPLSPEGLNFRFENAAAPGTYPLSSLSVRNYYSISSSQPTVTLTNFPGVTGGYYEGAISLQFTDYGTNQSHTLSGSFRLKRRF